MALSTRFRHARASPIRWAVQSSTVTPAWFHERAIQSEDCILLAPLRAELRGPEARLCRRSGKGCGDRSGRSGAHRFNAIFAEDNASRNFERGTALNAMVIKLDWRLQAECGMQNSACPSFGRRRRTGVTTACKRWNKAKR